MIRGSWSTRWAVMGAAVIGTAVAVAATAAAAGSESAPAPPAPTRSTSFASLAAEKASIAAEAEAHARAEAAPPAPKTPPPPGSLPTAGHETWPTGIQDTRQPPVPGGFTQVDEWDGLVDGQHVGVHAGVASTDITGTTAPLGPGSVIVTATDCAECAVTVTEHPDPGTVGPLRIVSVRFPQILLRDADGRSVTFDALTRAFDG